jgi:hypothetical protein
VNILFYEYVKFVGKYAITTRQQPFLLSPKGFFGLVTERFQLQIKNKGIFILVPLGGILSTKFLIFTRLFKLK